MGAISETMGRILQSIQQLRWFLPDLTDHELSNEVLRRRIFVSVLSITAAPVMIFFAWLEHNGGAWFMVPLLGCGSALLFVTYYLLRTGQADLGISRIALAFISIVALIPVLLDRGPHQMFYLLLIPLIAVFVFGIIEGAIWGATFLTLIFLATHPEIGVNLPSLAGSKLDFVSAYLITFGFSLGYETLRQKTQDIADQNNQNLKNEHAQLLTAQQDLLKNEERFRRYTRIATDWLFELDADLNITYISSKFEEVTGIWIHRQLGKNVLTLIHRYGDCDTEAHRRGVLNHEPFRDFRYSLISSTGKKVWVMTRGEPLFSETGKFLGYIGTGTDVTAYEEFQEEIRTKDRTLHHVQKIDAVGQLTSGVAHDFNNLLTIISGNLELIRFQAKDNVDTEAIDAIASASNQAADLTSKLL